MCCADDKQKLDANGTLSNDASNDKLDAWTAHKTESDIVYYYNALTGESTYVKPAGFKGEVLTHIVISLTRYFPEVISFAFTISVKNTISEIIFASKNL